MFQLAQAKLMTAMEALLEVPSADAAMLKNMAAGKFGKAALVVFYAPWCPHCQSFVLHDKKGDPVNAPLELLRKQFLKSDSTKNVAVMRADVTRLGQSNVPPEFKVPAIPTVYFVSEHGKPIKFVGNPHDSAALSNFVNSQVKA